MFELTDDQGRSSMSEKFPSIIATQTLTCKGASKLKKKTIQVYYTAYTEYTEQWIIAICATRIINALVHVWGVLENKIKDHHY